MSSQKVAKAQVASFTVSASAPDGGGTLSPPSQVVNAGSTAWVSITPDPGYHVISVSDNGFLDDGHKRPIPNPYPLVNVQADHTVAVSFAYYGVELRHDYRSSVDGAALPCGIYKPNVSVVSDTTKIPLWVDLHAFGGPGVIGKPGADYDDMFILSPWGRNYKSIYADGRNAANPITGTPEPALFDDFASSATGWTPVDSTWRPSDGIFEQPDPSPSWKFTDRGGSNGADYTVSADLKETGPRTAGESAMGIMFRKQANGDGYLLDLDNNGGLIYLRLRRYQGGAWTDLAYDPLGYAVLDPSDPAGNRSIAVQYTENDPFWRNPINLKVHVFKDVIEVQINNLAHYLDASMSFAKKTKYGKDNSTGTRINDGTWSSGTVALASFGASHQFDNFRVQNEFLFGETDVLDCINQFIEEFSVDPQYRVDPTRIYLSGFSMGGVGTWNVGLHNPDLFRALHPAFGTTDLWEGRRWIKNNYPDTKGRTHYFWGTRYYKEEQDSFISETTDAFLVGNIDNPNDPNYKLGMSSLHEYSSRWILENALNMPLRIEHPEYDSLIPNNTNSDTTVLWFTFAPTGAPLYWTLPAGTFKALAGLKPSYAHSKQIWQKWYPSGVPTDGKPTTGLSKVRQETSGYGANGASPPAPNPKKPNEPNTSNIWDRYNYSKTVYSGAHGLPSMVDYLVGRLKNFCDWQFPARVYSFWQRSNTSHYAEQMDPSDVAYKTFDSQHNKAWWLNVESAKPDQDIPALVRISNGRKKASPYDGAEIHVKNTKAVTLDLTRMGIDTTNSSTDTTKLLTFKLDNNTAPEAETVTDTYNGATLKLVGTWFPAKWSSYTVKLGSTDLKSNSSMTGTVLTITDVPVTGTQTELTVIVPTNDASNSMLNMLESLNPGFENNEADWTKAQHLGLIDGTGTGLGIFEIDSIEKAHTGAGSARVKDSTCDSEAPDGTYNSCWVSSEVSVSGSTSYSASAFVKTRILLSKTKSFKDGIYDPATNSRAGVGILWLDSDKNPIGLDTMASGEAHGSNDWTPVELRIASPSEASYAKVVVYCKSPDNQGSSGSVWFDDVTLRE